MLRPDRYMLFFSRRRRHTRSSGRTPWWWSWARSPKAPQRMRRRRRAMPELHETIVRPVVTEKSSAAYGARKEYAFRVHSDATKPQIKADRKSTRLNSSHLGISDV